MNKQIIDKKVKQLTKRIVKEVSPEKVILFGSYAWGKPGNDSDLDLFVVQRTKESKRARQLKLRRLLLDFDMPADILSYTQEEIDHRLKIKDFFIRDIMNNGKIIYAK